MTTEIQKRRLPRITPLALAAALLGAAAGLCGTFAGVDQWNDVAMHDQRTSDLISRKEENWVGFAAATLASILSYAAVSVREKRWHIPKGPSR